MKRNKSLILKVLLGGMLTSFIFVMCFAFTGVAFAEEVATATAEATQTATATTQATTTTGVDANTIKSAVDWLKSLSMDDLKGWLAGGLAFLITNATIILGLAIALIKLRVSQVQKSNAYEALKAKMDVDHQEKMENLVKEFNAKLDECQVAINESIASLDEKKKEEAKNSIATLQEKLNDIKVEVEK